MHTNMQQPLGSEAARLTLTLLYHLLLLLLSHVLVDGVVIIQRRQAQCIQCRLYLPPVHGQGGQPQVRVHGHTHQTPTTAQAAGCATK